jgi:hypothetical protein
MLKYTTPMEKRIGTKVDEYVTQLKNDIRTKIFDLNLSDASKTAELLEFVFDYDRLVLQKEDFVKRRRVKNSVPCGNRCSANRANGEQCTRRRKTDCEFCGTHSKGTPHGLVQIEGDSDASHRMEVFAQEINGIVYYIDSNNNVYKTEDVLEGKDNPKIVAKCVNNGNSYTIPEFGLI